MNGLPVPVASALGCCVTGPDRIAQYLYLVVNNIPEREKQNIAGRLDIDDIRVAAACYDRPTAVGASFPGGWSL